MILEYHGLKMFLREWAARCHPAFACGEHISLPGGAVCSVEGNAIAQ